MWSVNTSARSEEALASGGRLVGAKPPENVRAARRAREHVRQPVLIQIRHGHRGSGARSVVDEVRHELGAGSTVTVTDLNKDGLPDVLTGTTRGTYIFWGLPAN